MSEGRLKFWGEKSQNNNNDRRTKILEGDRNILEGKNVKDKKKHLEEKKVKLGDNNFVVNKKKESIKTFGEQKT